MQLLAHETLGQFNTPTVNGSISGGEYGSHLEGDNMLTSDSAEWYMTWDANNLYVGIKNVSIGGGNAAVMYFDIDPIDTLPDV